MQIYNIDASNPNKIFVREKRDNYKECTKFGLNSKEDATTARTIAEF